VHATFTCLDEGVKPGHALRIIGNRVLRRIFGAKREEVEGGWRRLHDGELGYYVVHQIYFF
jgi:hypothetical protein